MHIRGKNQNNRKIRSIKSGGWTSDRVKEVARLLKKEYGNPHHFNKEEPLDELVFIILSSRTNEKNYLRAYDSLKTKFPTWKVLLESPYGSINDIIGFAGLSNKKEDWIRDCFSSIVDRMGAVDISCLHEMKTEDAELFLTSLPGIGLKSARCVLMYSLKRKSFPVDTHCRRILSRLGLIKFERLTDDAQNRIQSKITPSLRFSLHVNLVAHGRKVCRGLNPRCTECCIAHLCRYDKRTKAS